MFRRHYIRIVDGIAPSMMIKSILGKKADAEQHWLIVVRGLGSFW
jgi:hypothetical protein